MCGDFSHIPQDGDFRMRVSQEDRSMEKRGTRSTNPGRRLGYLSILELGNQSRKIQKKYQTERAYHGHNRRRIAQLQIYRSLFWELKNSFDVQSDILKFCTDILTAHTVGAFGGKATL